MQDKDLENQLAQVDLFAQLPKKHLAGIVSRGRVVEHAQGKEITTQGESGIGFHLILDGQALVIISGQERGTMGPGEYFGDISLIDGKPRTATVQAQTPLRTFAITAWEFAPLLESEPTVALELLKRLCARLRAAESAKVS